MNDWLEKTLCERYESERLLKVQESGGYIELLKNRENGLRLVRRHVKSCENADVYKRIMRIKNPALCRVYDIVSDGEAADVLEEYIEGATLVELCEKTADVKTAVRISLQICEGLGALHKISVIHRDIKPGNVILRNSSAVIIDYGISRIYKTDADSDTTIFGTPGYAAPEQYGYAQTDASSDIYSLGVLMNMLMTGVHPSKRLADNKKAAAIIRKCISTNSADRYHNAAELAADLQRV